MTQEWDSTQGDDIRQRVKPIKDSLCIVVTLARPIAAAGLAVAQLLGFGESCKLGELKRAAFGM